MLIKFYDIRNHRIYPYRILMIPPNKSVELTACSLRVYRKGRAGSTLIRAAAHFHVVLQNNASELALRWRQTIEIVERQEN